MPVKKLRRKIINICGFTGSGLALVLCFVGIVLFVSIVFVIGQGVPQPPKL